MTEIQGDSRVLQIGSDYGSCTGLLARRAGETVVLDPRDENLEVNRLRHGTYGNLRFVRGGIQSRKPDIRSISQETERLPWSFRGKGLTLFLWPEPWSSIRRKRQRRS